ncbi:MAG: hypothetical protein IKQ43_05985 [Treponema sp.]|nr:hypothetical protein [Treponema sp.]MBR7078966.1 hypothetical protein [Treponema sp.]
MREKIMEEIKFEVKQTFGTLSETKSGWKTELKLVSWSDRPAKYDIRSWAPDGAKMGKGITMTAEELKKLRDILNEMNI